MDILERRSKDGRCQIAVKYVIVISQWRTTIFYLNINDKHLNDVCIAGDKVNRLRSLVGLIALSVHAGLEGLSVGLGENF